MRQSLAEHVVYHFTHVSHFQEIVRDGLSCDSAIRRSGSLGHEAGNRDIKASRRTTPAWLVRREMLCVRRAKS